ncbi:MAG: class I SAM-dependent methyltransferase [Erysipelotrichaceae bacterium]|nr:class I SAM-dependent methyltransferase [Erysipelotrichaceae bacterium]
MNNTINYYNKNAKDYFDSTVNADMSDVYQKFLKYLPKHAYILDIGCGSGRDSKFFLSQRYKVEAIDGSEELCQLASEYIGQKVNNIKFNELDYEDMFDGIWACASLLHVKKEEIEDVIRRLYKALKHNGVFYVSFKYGESDRIQGERYFNDMNESSVKELLKGFEIMELWLSDDVRPERSDRWINIICEKKAWFISRTNE